MIIKPDFLIKPYEVHSCPGLRQGDGDVYAVVYWFEKMKDGKCTAGNDTIADIAGVKIRSVGGALERLESNGFIERVYSDKNRRSRTEIKTLVHFTKKDGGQKIYKTKAGKIPKDIHMEPGEIVQLQANEVTTVDEVKETPGQVAADFFTKESNRRSIIIDEMAADSGAPRDVIASEVRKFYAYWTEPNKSGTKQKWQLERTFEVKRRLYTWLSRAGKFNAAGRRGAGSGTTI